MKLSNIDFTIFGHQLTPVAYPTSSLAGEPSTPYEDVVKLNEHLEALQRLAKNDQQTDPNSDDSDAQASAVERPAKKRVITHATIQKRKAEQEPADDDGWFPNLKR